MDHLLVWSGIEVLLVEFILEMFREDEEKASGWSSPRSPAKKCSGWWRNSSVSSSADPPMNSGEDTVDVVGLDGFHLRSLVGEKAREGGVVFCMRGQQQEGEEAWVR
jgi:hypothetical protein